MKTTSFSNDSLDPFFARVVTCPHWQEVHVQRAKNANGFNELGELVCEVAALMPKPLFMISGPMTTGGMGSYSKNILLFQHTIDEALLSGVSVFNQTMLEEHLQRLVRVWLAENTHLDYCDHVLTDVYKALLDSGHINGLYLLPDWHTSRGAKWEREVGEKLNLNLHEYPQEWYDRAVKRTEDFFGKE